MAGCIRKVRPTSPAEGEVVNTPATWLVVAADVLLEGVGPFLPALPCPPMGMQAGSYSVKADTEVPHQEVTGAVVVKEERSRSLPMRPRLS